MSDELVKELEGLAIHTNYKSLREAAARIRLLEQQLKTAREKALEEAAQVAERDVDWSAFGKAAIEPWEKGQDSLRDYRLGIVSGRAIAAAIRSLGEKE